MENLGNIGKIQDLEKISEESIFTWKQNYKLTDIVSSESDPDHVDEFKKRCDKTLFPILQMVKIEEELVDVYQHIADKWKLQEGEFLEPEPGRKLKRRKLEDEGLAPLHERNSFEDWTMIPDAQEIEAFLEA